MAEVTPKIEAVRPTNIFLKPVTVDFKGLFKALTKGVSHYAVAKWDELGNDAVEALASFGLATEPGELAFVLIRRAAAQALFDLIGEAAGQVLVGPKQGAEALLDQMDLSVTIEGVPVDSRFFDRPGEIRLVKDLQVLLRRWLAAQSGEEAAAEAMAARFPSYFVYALNREWRRSLKSYQPLAAALDTPFTKAGDREWAWNAYAAFLKKSAQEGVMGEAFGLDQIFVDLNAWYGTESGGAGIEEMQPLKRPRTVVPLERELQRWLGTPSREDAIRVISGGPGSGKSSFARIFAARMAERGGRRCLLVPLHLIDPEKDLGDEVGRFVRDEGILARNPLDPESPEPDLLLILDGLDELASQGKASAETARAFLREVERTVERRNLQTARLRVLICGREMVVQEYEPEFRRPGQILNLLPYFVDEKSRKGDGYVDPEGLLQNDLRQQWWKKYGLVSGRNYAALPQELQREDLEEITAQPLLNYLVALSYRRGTLDFGADVNLNRIYADLVKAVHARAYERHRWAPIRHMSLEDFFRVLEEIGLAAWHGDGRTATVGEIEAHCRASGVGSHLDKFQEGARAGVTRLLAAFFFRQWGQRASGDATFVFTHKSFGEYLAARRVVRTIWKVVRELDRRSEGPDEGWDDREALKHWVQICGPSAISKSMHGFLLNEVRLRDGGETAHWQEQLARLFSYMLAQGSPMEEFHLRFKDSLFQSRNAEEALLAALNACARVTGKVSAIKQPDKFSFGSWLSRVQGPRWVFAPLVLKCLSLLDLSGANLLMAYLIGADLDSSLLRGAQLAFAHMLGANLTNADLVEANISRAYAFRADFTGANLRGVHASEAGFERAKFKDAQIDDSLTGDFCRVSGSGSVSLTPLSHQHWLRDRSFRPPPE